MKSSLLCSCRYIQLNRIFATGPKSKFYNKLYIIFLNVSPVSCFTPKKSRDKILQKKLRIKSRSSIINEWISVLRNFHITWAGSSPYYSVVCCTWIHFIAMWTHLKICLVSSPGRLQAAPAHNSIDTDTVTAWASWPAAAQRPVLCFGPATPLL